MGPLSRLATTTTLMHRGVDCTRQTQFFENVWCNHCVLLTLQNFPSCIRNFETIVGFAQHTDRAVSGVTHPRIFHQDGTQTRWTPSYVSWLLLLLLLLWDSPGSLLSHSSLPSVLIGSSSLHPRHPQIFSLPDVFQMFVLRSGLWAAHSQRSRADLSNPWAQVGGEQHKTDGGKICCGNSA